MQPLSPHICISRLTTHKHTGLKQSKHIQVPGPVGLAPSMPLEGGRRPEVGNPDPPFGSTLPGAPMPGIVPETISLWEGSGSCLLGSQLDTMTSRSGWLIVSFNAHCPYLCFVCSSVRLRVMSESRTVTGHEVPLTHPHLSLALREALPRSADASPLGGEAGSRLALCPLRPLSPAATVLQASFLLSLVSTAPLTGLPVSASLGLS